MQTLIKVLGRERGQTFVEYATVLAFVSVPLLGAYALFDVSLSDFMSSVTSTLGDVL